MYTYIYRVVKTYHTRIHVLYMYYIYIHLPLNVVGGVDYMTSETSYSEIYFYTLNNSIFCMLLKNNFALWSLIHKTLL